MYIFPDFANLTATASLPIRDVLPEIDAVLARQRNLVVSAPPGSGKTSLVPLSLLNASWRDGKIWLIAPRRVAVHGAAQRMAALCDEAVGGKIGFTTRLERVISPQTEIEVMTEGVFLRRVLTNPFLEGVSTVIFDEVHERSLELDTSLALALSAQRNLRETLRIIAMSATLESDAFSQLMRAAQITCEGREFPLTLQYVARDIQSLGDLPKAASLQVRRAMSETPHGNLLVFLPGMREIRATQALLENVDARVLALHGDLPIEMQDLIFSPTEKRQIVLATSIAETSLTLPDTRVVIDGGFRRAPHFNAATGLTRLETVRISRAAAQQRAGRAGREGPGTAVRLWTEAMHRGLTAFDPPEILKADLSPLVMHVAVWRDVTGLDDARAFLLQALPQGGVDAATRLLEALGAMEASGLTDFGRSMARYGAHPRLAAMLASAETPAARATASDLCALLEEKDPLRRPPEEGGRKMEVASSDVVWRLDALHGGPTQGGDLHILRRIRNVAARYRAASHVSARTEIDLNCVGPFLAAAFPDRLAMDMDGTGRYRLAGGGSAQLPATDPMARHKFLVVPRLHQMRAARIALAAAIAIENLPPAIAGTMKVTRETALDPTTGRVISREKRRLGRLLLSERDVDVSDADLTALLLEDVRHHLRSALNWTDACDQFQARVMLGRQLRSDLPQVDDAHLSETLEDWLAPWISDCRSRTHLAALDLISILKSRLNWAQQNWLDANLPQCLHLPRGMVKINYAAPNPTISARAQLFYGCAETPHIAAGAIKLQFALLSPAGRVQAITSDLARFWKTGWADMRRDMRGRYPKHDWPEDPADTKLQTVTRRNNK